MKKPYKIQGFLRNHLHSCHQDRYATKDHAGAKAEVEFSKFLYNFRNQGLGGNETENVSVEDNDYAENDPEGMEDIAENLAFSRHVPVSNPATPAVSVTIILYDLETTGLDFSFFPFPFSTFRRTLSLATSDSFPRITFLTSLRFLCSSR